MVIKNLISNGFVASHLADYMLSKGEEVYVYYRWTDDRSAFNHIIDKVNWVLMDLNDLKSCIDVIAKIQPNYIYHLGAQSFVPASFIYPAETIRTNTIGTLNLLEAVRYIKDISEELTRELPTDVTHIRKLLNQVYNPTIVVVSSSEVYGQVPEDKLPITEQTELSPNNPYAVGKIGEDMIGLVYWKNYGLKVIRTRMFTHSGPRRVMMSAECYYAKYIAEIEQGKRAFEIPCGNMNSIRTWADVRDAVRAYHMLARNGNYGEVYNIGGENVKSIQEVLDYMLSISTIRKDSIRFYTDNTLLRKADVTKQIVDISKFKQVCPEWKPEYSWEQTMQDILDFWREYVKR